jgi:hypothetical protein
MYTLITDETNTQESEDGDFFIYGGLIFSPDQMKQVTDDIESIRTKYGSEPPDKLKFDTRSRPKHVSRKDYTCAKNDVIEACLKAEVQFIAYMVLHKVAKDERAKGEWALNSVLVAFSKKFLLRKKDYGIVVIDRLPGNDRAYDMLKRKFQQGLRMQSTGNAVKLERVLLYATTCDGASHLSSAVDIVLGSLRWVVNQRRHLTSDDLSQKMLEKVGKMMYHRASGEVRYVREYGLILRPKSYPGHPPYRQEYEDLVAYLERLLEEDE